MNFWHRLEPNTVDSDVEQGVEARIADPLWSLARQWQLGEFAGEDAASPIHVRATAVSHPVQTFRNDTVANARVEPFTSTHPLECRVEAEAVLNGPGAIALAGEAGIQFLRRLDAAGLAHLRQTVDWRKHVGFDYGAEGLDLTALPAPAQRRLELYERRALDGRKLHEMQSDKVASLVPSEYANDVHHVHQAWQLEYREQFREPAESGATWLNERLEYTFSVGVATNQQEVVLAAHEYHGGHLDWYHFSVAEDQTHGLRPERTKPQVLELLPQPATFRGQGAARWWEFEDRAVYFGNLSAGPADVARLMVAEYGTVFSDDWFVVPLTVQSGSLNRVTALEVLDVFGGSTHIRSTAVEDYERFGAGRPFRHFELDADDSASRELTPWLFVPPSLADSMNARPVESVTLFRDENANLGWAVEQLIEMPTGEPMPRRRQWVGAGQTADTAAADDGSPQAEDLWHYRLQTPVPPWWIPLMPERITSGAQMRLRRARLQSWQELDQALVGAKGLLLGMRQALHIFEEEVPAGGVVVTRAWQRARGADGAVHVWMARRKRPGRGDRGSGLEFDGIDGSATERN